MAKLVFAMNQSLDGYVDHTAFAPTPEFFRYFIDMARKQTGSLYGRRLYEIMRYWDEDDPSWNEDERAFADAWRRQPKWVVSRSLKSVGPNAFLLDGDLESSVQALKSKHDGEIDVGGPALAQSLSELHLIDEYRLFLHPVVLGHGTPLFGGPLPRLRLVANERIADQFVGLTYVPG